MLFELPSFTEVDVAEASPPLPPPPPTLWAKIPEEPAPPVKMEPVLETLTAPPSPPAPPLPPNEKSSDTVDYFEVLEGQQRHRPGGAASAIAAAAANAVGGDSVRIHSVGRDRAGLSDRDGPAAAGRASGAADRNPDIEDAAAISVTRTAGAAAAANALRKAGRRNVTVGYERTRIADLNVTARKRRTVPLPPRHRSPRKQSSVPSPPLPPPPPKT